MNVGCKQHTHTQDPVISQALVGCGLVAALVEELRTQQALVINGAADGPEPEAPSSPTSGVMRSAAHTDSPASKDTVQTTSPLESEGQAQEARCVDRLTVPSTDGSTVCQWAP